jgi:RNA polymerase sigma factor (sigma-70 family)
MRSTDSHLDQQKKAKAFEALLLPHLDAAYNLARWLTRNDQNAEDLVQMAYLRAFKFFDGFRGADARAWLLTILRNAYFTSLRDNRHEAADVSFDEDIPVENGQKAELSSYDVGNSPENALASKDTTRMVNQALETLPPAFREVIVLKEMDDLSYKEIAEIAGIPIGTVMSRLARGRKLLGELLKNHATGG